MMEKLNQIQTFRSILVTHTRAYGEGTSVAADLAGMLAYGSKRVALVDADLRRPQLHTLFGVPNRTGLADALAEPRTLDAAMLSVNSNHLFLLPAGQNAAPAEDIFESQRLNGLLRQLKTRYDKVIIQGPSFFYPEVTCLAAAVDGVVLLIHPSQTRQDPSQVIMEKFRRSGANVIGVVMREQPKYQVNQSAFLDKLLTYDRRSRVTP